MSGTLKSGNAHSWKKNTYSELSFDWADVRNPGTGDCSVKLGDAATSYSVPQASLAITKSLAGKLTNNTDKTISYKLS